MSAFRNELIVLVAEHLNLPEQQVASANDLEELGLDSLGVIDVITLLERHYKVRLSNEALEAIRSMDDLVGALEQSVLSHA